MRARTYQKHAVGYADRNGKVPPIRSVDPYATNPTLPSSKTCCKLGMQAIRESQPSLRDVSRFTATTMIGSRLVGGGSETIQIWGRPVLIAGCKKFSRVYY